MKYKTAGTIIILATFFSARSQETQQLLNNLVSEDSTAIAALSLYPENVRKNILVACSYPEALVRMDALQKNTRASFRQKVERYSKDEQKEIWDLTRYPGLISKLAAGNKKSREELKKVAAEYPEEIRETAMKYGLQKQKLLDTINTLSINADKAFESVMKEYPEKAKIALQELVKYPEVVDILTSEMKMTVLAGDLYKKQPELVLKKLDSISIAHAVESAKDRQDWIDGLEKNPEAKKEMEEAAKDFAKEQGYDQDDLYVNNEIVVREYITYPYPYWYGYPSWYGYPYWYPYPYWFDLGFYWGGPYGSFYFGFPSAYFSYWYFSYPYNYYHYPHYADYCLNHYYGHHSPTGFHHEVSNWVNSTQPAVPKNFFQTDAGRPDRIRELGKFESDYARVIKNNPEMTISKREYLQQNASMYPAVSPVLRESRLAVGTPGQERPIQAPDNRSGRQQPQHPNPEYPSQKTPAHPQVQPTAIPKQRPTPKQVPQPMPHSRPMPQSRPMPPSLPQSRPKPIPKSRPASAPRPQGTAAEGYILKDDFSRISEAGDYHRLIWSTK